MNNLSTSLLLFSYRLYPNLLTIFYCVMTCGRTAEIPDTQSDAAQVKRNCAQGGKEYLVRILRRYFDKILRATGTRLG
jgi:hypothetical protein